jgi:hypothetical protein
MSRRKFLSTAAILTAGTAMAGIPLETYANKRGIAHQVYFWLKRPDSDEDKMKLIEGINSLKKIETVREMHIGIVAATEKRSVIDDTWNVSELIYFDDLAGQAVYQVHPLHQAFAKNYSHLWSKVVVYDSALI